MRLKISIMTLVIGVVALTTSCNKYLDEIPDNRTEITDASKIGKILVNAYPSVVPALALEHMTDNFTDNGRQYPLYSNLGEQYYTFSNVINEIAQDSPNQYWSAYYEAIAHANIALEAIEDIGGGAEYDAYKGEALLCRAYSHFMLANIFCDAYNSDFADRERSGIPYATESEREVFVAYERGTLEQTYQNIIRDLEEGLPLLDDSFYSQPKYHFTVAAANAFAADVYLFYSMHSDAAVREERLNKVITHADNAIRGNVFRNLSGYAETQNPEMMTQMWVSSAEATNLLITTAISTWGRVHAYSTRISLNGLIEPDVLTGGGPWGTGRLAGMNGTVYGVSYLNYFFCKTMAFITYTNVSAGIGYFRAASVPLSREKALLAKAEAHVLLGDYAQAAIELNKWYSVWEMSPINVSVSDIVSHYQNNASIGNTRTLNAKGTRYISDDSEKLAMLHAVLHARRIETVHEGNRVFDLRRYAMSFDHIWDGEETMNINAVTTDELGNSVAANRYFDPATMAHDLRLTLQLPEMVLSKAPANWRNPR